MSAILRKIIPCQAARGQMPVANRLQKQQSRSIAKRDLRGPLGALILAVAILTIGFMFALYNSGGFTLGQQTKFEKYLNEKYGQEFVVENVRVTGAGLGIQGSWRGDAYPKSNPSLKFEISRSQTTGDINFDSFLQTLWTKQASSNVEDFLSEHLPENDGYYLLVMAGSTSSDFYRSVQGETPSLTEMLEKNRNKLSYNLSVRSVAKLTSGEPTDRQLNEAFKVISFAKKLNINKTSVGYAYRDSSYKKKDKVGQQMYQYRIRVEDENLRGIGTATDLNQYFSELTQ